VFAMVYFKNRGKQSFVANCVETNCKMMRAFFDIITWFLSVFTVLRERRPSTLAGLECGWRGIFYLSTLLIAVDNFIDGVDKFYRIIDRIR
jgi:hypothetical protein